MSFIQITKRYIIPIILGLVGMGIFQAGLHLYQDHRNLHAVFELIRANQQQQAQKQQPPEKSP